MNSSIDFYLHEAILDLHVKEFVVPDVRWHGRGHVVVAAQHIGKTGVYWK